jgi:hypothetical protein
MDDSKLMTFKSINQFHFIKGWKWQVGKKLWHKTNFPNEIDKMKNYNN